MRIDKTGWTILWTLVGAGVAALIVWSLIFNAHGRRPSECTTGLGVGAGMVESNLAPGITIDSEVTVRSEVNPDLYFVAIEVVMAVREGDNIGTWAILLSPDYLGGPAVFSVSDEATRWSGWRSIHDAGLADLAEDPAEATASYCLLIHGG